jgi:starch phosphorylase
MTEYKRPDLLFSDIERLRRIARARPFKQVFAGKAQPSDEPGKHLIAFVHECLRQIRDDIPSIYVADYDTEIALRLVGGTDIWLNTPLRPLEASGTSGMKAAFNGVPSLSILDGWWVEGCIEGINGWAIGDPLDTASSHDQEAMYRKLEDTVLPLYHDDRTAWTAVMKGAITKSASYFNSQRMMRRYVSEAYMR